VKKNIVLHSLIALFSCLYGTCHGMKQQKVSKNTKILLGSFHSGNRGAFQTLSYFSKVLPESQKANTSVAPNPQKSSVASYYQDAEIKEFKSVCNRMVFGQRIVGQNTCGSTLPGDYLESMSLEKKKKIVAGGFCQGGHVVCTAFAKYAKELKKNNVVGLFLEAPIGSLGENFDYLFFYIPACVRKIIHSVYVKYILGNRAYNVNKVHPVDMAKQASNIPVLLIASKNDRVTPSCLSLKFAKDLAASGYKNIYVYMYDGKNVTFCQDIAVSFKRFWNVAMSYIPRTQFKVDSFHGVARQGKDAQEEYGALLEQFIALCSGMAEQNEQMDEESMQQYKKNEKQLMQLEKEYNTWRNYLHNTVNLGCGTVAKVVNQRDVKRFLMPASIFLTLYFGYIFCCVLTGNEPSEYAVGPLMRPLLRNLFNTTIQK